LVEPNLERVEFDSERLQFKKALATVIGQHQKLIDALTTILGKLPTTILCDEYSLNRSLVHRLKAYLLDSKSSC